MEEVGAQVAAPIFIHHQQLPSRFCEAPPIPMARKRDLPYQTSNYQQYQQNQRFQNPRDNWNPKVWDWDSVGFVAKPIEPNMPRLGSGLGSTAAELKNQNEIDSHNPNLSVSKVPAEVDEESLRLKLGGCLSTGDQPPVSRPNKRVRSGSPGTGSYPMCQVDNCKEDLSNAKDYHRRHKVCEVHSKSTKALVCNQMQRFCQQCSRFHPLLEFDEGKRSCRRRLAGHNRRRRKTQPEDVTSRLSLPGNRDSSGSGSMDIVNLLTILARAQGNNRDKNANCSSVPDRDQLIQVISKINSLPLPANLAAKLPVSGILSRNLPEQASLEQQNRLDGNASTTDLLAVLSATLATSAPDALAVLSQRCSQSSDSEKSKPNGLDNTTGFNLQEKSTLEFPSVGAERSSSSYQSLVEDSDCQVQETRTNLPLQLFSSSPEDDSPPKLASVRKYFSSDSSNPMDERSPPPSPPVVQKLFPMRTLTETVKPERISVSREVNANIEAARSHGCSMPLQLFREPNRGADNGSFQSSPYQAGYASSSGSDHSPSSLNSDAQDRTGRIMFKLFDKDPSHFPVTLRTQIYKWLSHSPSEMESYIRPGCVVLSIYVSMSSAAWKQLEENLLQRVSSLVQDSNSDFWRNGRFLIHTGKQLASFNDGKIWICKSWRTWKMPELISVSPLAVVDGEETALLLRGRNLTAPGTKIHCTYMGGYMSKEVSDSSHQGSIYDEINYGSFKICNTAPSTVGRCFIEVENGFKGNSFPVIVANATICRELRILESEFDEDDKMCDANVEDQSNDFGRLRSREEVLHFLNELGWLFQRNRFSSLGLGPDYMLTRFKFLFTFSVERDCCALVKTLLDMFVERNLSEDGLSREALDVLSEIHLLNRAVKKRCMNMVDLLTHYSVFNSNDSSKKYIFSPNDAGPGGITPLHLAASTSGSDDMVDVLTNDPLEVGLRCWNSLLDANGLSPYSYALMRNNHSYNRLVARKLADKRNGQVSVPIGNEIRQQTLEQDPRLIHQFKMGSSRSCERCAVLATKYNTKISRSQSLLQRPYIHPMLAIAAVCVCVCLFLRGGPNAGLDGHFKWESLGYGSI
ncbi:squamosa promoter-binding-like protein 14 [Malania oleifera]|uniref:squamosa promoter-binding-like protein 14 n=1 Tax=Malania oleifera TaxID=397392 RepID=UPI0025AE82F6|nr:squamosa promoter-binding-like protein 14 [Malania oleifera]